MYYISIGQCCSNLHQGTFPDLIKEQPWLLHAASPMSFYLPSIPWVTCRYIYIVVYLQYSTSSSVISSPFHLLKSV